MGRMVAVDEEDLKMIYSTIISIQTDVEILTFLVKKLIGKVVEEEVVER